jgi:glycosyltransferase involved in cell wall biosynthesis
VTVIMAVRNEAPHIADAIESVLRQTYPRERIDIIVADGLSTDATASIAAAAARGCRLSIISNPRRSYPAGLNVAVGAAQGDVIVKLDGHAELDERYIDEAVRALADTNAAVVGPRIRTRGRGSTGKAIAFALSHPLVVGGAEFRYPGPTKPSASVPFGAYRREIFTRVGPFREDIGRAEDLEFHARIRAHGGRLLLLGDTLATYWCRDTFARLAAQYFASGADLARHPRGTRPYQIAPPIALAGFVIVSVAALLSRLSPAVPIGAALGYLVLPATVAVKARQENVSSIKAAAAAMVTHASQACGYWWALITLWRRRP